MERENQITSANKENNLLSDEDWIWASMDSLSELGAILFHNYGRGAILINKNNIFQPPKYILADEIRNDEAFPIKLKDFIENYNPAIGFVISFDQGDKQKNKAYQVDVIEVNQQIG